MFNLFNKDMRTVTEEDLAVLKTVSEGWNIEYKREKPNSKKISKSIASFANSHGGIYFIGIEAEKSTNQAKDFPGVDGFPDLIRDAVNGNLQPFPYFTTYTIKLSNSKSVIAVVIPEGEDPPYIHSDGRIYRRQESASDPIPETNRHTIDELYNKAIKNKEKIEKFRENDLTFNSTEGSTPYLEILINTSPFNHFKINNLTDNSNMDELKKSFNIPFNISEDGDDLLRRVSLQGSAKFDTVNTYHDSIVLRDLNSQNLAFNGITIIIDTYGNLKAYIPMNAADFYSAEGTGLQYLELLPETKRKEFDSIELLNARSLFGMISLIVTKYSDYLIGKGYKNSIEVKMRLTNCWRKILHIQSNIYFEHLKKFGIPICMKSEQYFPEYPIEFSHEFIKGHHFLIAAKMFAQVAEALGLPMSVTLSSIIEEMSNIKK